MALIDEIKIHAKAGKGGDGVVRWRHEKFVPKGGPAGGDGGNGGNFYALAVQDIGRLAKYSAQKKFKAEDGEDGGRASLHGANGKDFFIEFPVGSIITNLNTGEVWRLEKIGQTEMLLKGGRGGYGNEHFKSSTNTTPKDFTPGVIGEEADFLIELELFADIGLVGLPNAGKSSLLNMITNAKVKVGSYQFTTLDPNLGDFYGYIIADIPGLIEGASEGKGLGVKFLKHVKRTKMLAHLVAVDFSTDSINSPQANSGQGDKDIMMKNYLAIRKELEEYDKKNNLGNEGLSKKEEIIVLTKIDILDDQKKIEKIKKDFSNLGKKVFTLSLYDDKLIKEFSDNLAKILETKK